MVKVSRVDVYEQLANRIRNSVSFLSWVEYEDVGVLADKVKEIIRHSEFLLKVMDLNLLLSDEDYTHLLIEDSGKQYSSNEIEERCELNCSLSLMIDSIKVWFEILIGQTWEYPFELKRVYDKFKQEVDILGYSLEKELLTKKKMQKGSK